MADQPRLSEAERALLAELLEQEEHELPAEIRHTRTQEVKDQLHQRLELVRQLRERFQEAATA
jgi:hypothetical protein